jgi:2,4-dienoyl-CoA reductase-like NADH-dependent reductase (Old Yellow Enzyme family)
MIYLLQPLQAGPLALKNRLVMPPIVIDRADSEGYVTPEMLGFYREKTEGGYFGLVILENSYITREGKLDRRQLSIADDGTIEGLRRLANTVQANGSKCIMQINHAGMKADEASIGTMPVGPSSFEDLAADRRARELSAGEIEDIVQMFANAATRLKAAGFDGVEIHSAHGFLLNQFYSPLTNQRRDEYGGDVLHRIRIHLEVIEAIRSAVGKDFTISLRLGASDYMPGGTTISDSVIAARELEKAGIDLLSVSGGLSSFTCSAIATATAATCINSSYKSCASVSLPLVKPNTGCIAWATSPNSSAKIVSHLP